MNYNTDETSRQIKLKYVKEAGKVVIPLGLSLGATVGTVIILCNHSIKTEAALVSSLYLARQQLEQIRKYTTDKKIVNGVCLGQKDDIPDSKGRILVYEPYSDQVIPTTEAKIRKAEDKANARLQQNYLVRLSSIIRDLGGKPTGITDYIGWETANDIQMRQWTLAGSVYITLTRHEAHYSIHEKPLDYLDYDIPPAMLSS